ncbi:MAG: hypothetical protein IT324_20355 [Anaerolineae bacterium]|nr:hypothetical protein [Anaerolineae bacterium]
MRRKLLTVPFIVCCAVILAAGLGGTPNRVSADSPIQVIEQKVESKFRQSLTFHIKAKSTAGKIIKATLFQRSRGTDLAVGKRSDPFTPAAAVDVEYKWDTTDETTPPWQVIVYRWELTDDAGNVYNTADATTEISDDTRDWQKLTDGKVAVYWYDQQEAFGKELLSAAQRGFAHVAKATGHTPDGELRVVMYNTQEDFCTFYAPRACKNWVAGVTFGSLTVQWLEADNPDFVVYQVVPHELAHAFLHDWLGPRISAVPNWFNEGQAVNNELTGLDRELERARRLARSGKLERLAFMEARDTIGQDDLQLTADWYAQSAALITYLYERYGLDSLGKIVSQVKDGKLFEDAFKAATGVTLDEFELGWRDWLGAAGPVATIPPTPVLSFPPSPTYEPTSTPAPR